MVVIVEKFSECEGSIVTEKYTEVCMFDDNNKLVMKVTEGKIDLYTDKVHMSVLQDANENVLFVEAIVNKLYPSYLERE